MHAPKRPAKDPKGGRIEAKNFPDLTEVGEVLNADALWTDLLSPGGQFALAIWADGRAAA